MTGTVSGGKLAGVTNKTLYGDDFYRRIGAVGGARGTTGGFAADPLLARIAGKKGGHASRRSGAANFTEPQVYAIREFISIGRFTIQELATMYNVSYAVIRNIHIGRTYRDTFTGGCICHLCEMKRSPVA